ncbi:fasciclin-2-like protein [Anaeramoeba ignava]|uniref:Fasciclin-2-like protein n=1 Tax=Anaeramoeba ignava TaxID=1746090 RepID=A0A9Q0LWE6_ANAIG|nr:fasciclin-2-like protein [Anaeramoeba ignava]
MKKLLFFFGFFFFISFIKSELTLNQELYFPEGIEYPTYSFIDASNQLVYFADDPWGMDEYVLEGKLYKFNMSTLDLIDSLDLGIWGVGSGVFDTENNLAYFGSDSSPSQISKVDLNTFQVVGVLTLGTYYGFESAQIDIENQKAYFVSYYPAQVIKIDLNTFQQEGDPLELNYEYGFGSVIDLENNILYVSGENDYNYYSLIFKINLTDFTIIADLDLTEYDVYRASQGFLGVSKEFLYFGNYDYPFLVVKIDVETFSYDDALELEDYEWCVAAAIDENENTGYFVTEDPAIVRVDLDSFSFIDGEYLDGYSYSSTASFDFQYNYSFISLAYAEIIKFDLTKFQQEIEFLEPLFIQVQYILLDEPNQTIYLLFENYEYIIISKVDIESFQMIDYVILDYYDDIYAGDIDIQNGFLYYFIDDSGILVLKVDMFNLTNMEYVDIDSSGYVDDAVYDPNNNLLYLAYFDDDEVLLFLTLSCPDLEILDSIYIGDAEFYYFRFDYSTGYIYSYFEYWETEEEGDYIIKISTPDLNITDFINITSYDISTMSLDQANQRMYFGTRTGRYRKNQEEKLEDSMFSEICSIDLNYMEMISCQEVSGVYDFTDSFIDGDGNFGFFFTEFEDDFEELITAVIQLDLIQNTIELDVLDEYFDYPFGIFDPTTNFYYLTAWGNYPVPLAQFSIEEPLVPNVYLFGCNSLFSKFECYWFQIENDEQLQYQINYGFNWTIIEDPVLIDGFDVRYQEFNSSFYPNITGNEYYSIQIRACNLTLNECGKPSSIYDLITRIDSVKNYDLDGYYDYIDIFWDYPDVEIIEGIPNLDHYEVSIQKETDLPSNFSINDSSATYIKVDELEFGYTYYVSMWACSTEECEDEEKGEVVSSSISTGFPNVNSFDCVVSDVLVIDCSWLKPSTSGTPSYYTFTYVATTKEDSDTYYPNSTNQSFRANFQVEEYKINVSGCNSNDFCGLISTVNVTTERLQPPIIKQSISQIEEIKLIFTELTQGRGYLISSNNGTNWQNFTTLYSNETDMIGTLSPLSGNYEYLISIRGCTDSSCGIDYLGLPTSPISISPKLGNVMITCVPLLYGFYCDWEPLDLSIGLRGYSLSFNSTSKCLSIFETSYSKTELFGGANYEISIFASADSNCSYNEYSGNNTTLSITTSRLPPPLINQSISKIEEIEIIFTPQYQEKIKDYLVSINNEIDWQKFTTIQSNGNEMIGTIKPIAGNVEYIVSIKTCTDPNCESEYLGLASSPISITPKLGNISSFNCNSTICGFECNWESLELSTGLKGYSLSFNSTSICLSPSTTSYSKTELFGGANYEISIFASADLNCNYNEYSGLTSTLSLTTLPLSPPTINQSISKIEEIEIIFTKLTLAKTYLVSINNGIDWQKFTTIQSNGNEMIGTIKPLAGNVEYLVSILGCTDKNCESGYLGLASSPISITPKLGNISSFNCNPISCGFECNWESLELSTGLKGYSLSFNSTPICLSPSTTNYPFDSLIGKANYEISIFASADSNCNYNEYSGLNSTLSLTTLPLSAPTINQSISKIEEIEIIFTKLTQAKTYLVSINNRINWQNFTTIQSNGNEMIGTIKPIAGNVEYLVSIRGCTDSSCETQSLGLASSPISITPKLGNMSSINCNSTICGFECNWEALELSTGLKGYSLSYNSINVCLSAAMTSYSVFNLLGDTYYQISIFASADWRCEESNLSGLPIYTSVTTLPAPVETASDSSKDKVISLSVVVPVVVIALIVVLIILIRKSKKNKKENN